VLLVIVEKHLTKNQKYDIIYLNNKGVTKMKEKIPNCICSNCHKEFYKKPVEIKRYKNHFCCKECVNVFYKPQLRYCINCHKLLIKAQKKFCSTSCAAIINGHLYPKRKKIKETKLCISCNKILNKGKKYCSNKCRWEKRNIKLINDWLGNLFEGGDKTNGLVNHIIRRYLLQQNNYKCSKCEWGETNIYSNTIPLEVDHIDGDWRNNRPENLRVLCPNCHALTPTYKALNKTNFGRPIKTDRKKW